MANSKIVTYDLRSPGTNYNSLYEYLKSFPKWARITESTWFISSSKECVDIRNEINAIIDSNDRIFVAELAGVAAWRNVMCNSDFLKENL